MKRPTQPLALLITATLVACGGGNQAKGDGTGVAALPCSGACLETLSPAQARLSRNDVTRVLAQAVQEANAQGAKATIALSDRVGNILAVYRMTGASPDMRVNSGRTPAVNTGLENLLIPAELGAISKAITGAYLSSEGNAFSSRTASQIVQEHFNPGEFNQPAGPLFGVQFSQLACSDLVRKDSDKNVGPKQAPLGLSADPGGLPLYKNGTLVGGIGVMADGVYGLDLVITDRDRDLDELIAVAGTWGYSAPVDRRGDRITVDGKTFRFSDATFSDTSSAGQAPPALTASTGDLLAVLGYTANSAGVGSPGVLRAGVAYGENASGFVASRDARFAGLNAYELLEADGSRRFPPRAGLDTPTGATALTEAEVAAILRQALALAGRGRAQIRRPLGSTIQISASVVDSAGNVLGVLRSRDGPIFGTDVSLQKARTAAFFSSAEAGSRLQNAGAVSYLDIDRDGNGDLQISRRATAAAFSDYVSAVRGLFGAAALTGTHAFADRSGGNLSRPYFPDGVIQDQSGPLSHPYAQWSPFSTGLQLDLVYERIIQHVAYVLNLAPDVAVGCAGTPPAFGTGAPLHFDTTVPSALNNGLQIFPGSVPIYRDRVLVGAIGVSGDGVDQDDMIAFLSVHGAGLETGTFNNAPPDMRADQLSAAGVRLRYVQCPQTPFLDSDEQRVCEGK